MKCAIAQPLHYNTHVDDGARYSTCDACSPFYIKRAWLDMDDEFEGFVHEIYVPMI